MAKIITDKQQTQALDKINEAIRDAKILNGILREGEYALSSPNGKRSQIYLLDKEYGKKLEALLLKMREKKAEAAFKLADKFRIELSKEEIDILTGSSEDKEETPDEEPVSEVVFEQEEVSAPSPEGEDEEPISEKEERGFSWNNL